MRVVIPNFLDEEMLSYYLSHYNEDETPKFDKFPWKENPVVPNKHHTEYYIQYYDKVDDRKYIDYFLQRVNAHFDVARYKLRASIMRSMQIGGRSQWHSDDTPKLKEEVLSITINLNKEWDLSWGGLYLFEQEDNKQFYIPKFNEANCVLSPIKHSVSTIDKDAKVPRNTLQLWLYRDSDIQPGTVYEPKLVQEIFNEPVVGYAEGPAPLPEPQPIKEVISKPKIDWMNRG